MALDPMDMKVERSLAVVSLVSFVIGLYFPIAVLVDPGPSMMAYGIVLVSIPTWVVGTLTAGAGVYLSSRAGGLGGRLGRASCLLGFLNLAAIVACLVWSPAGIS